MAFHAVPVESARFVDTARAKALRGMGIHTVGDLIRHYPMRYLDLSTVASLREVKVGAEATVVGRVHEIRVKKPRPRLTITEIGIVDGTGVLLGVWFNQPYVERRFAPGDKVAFAGRVDLDFGFKQIKTPFVEKLSTDDDPTLSCLGRILPVHRTTEALSTNWLRRLIAAAVDDYCDVPDHLPSELREVRHLMPLRCALREFQFPEHLTSVTEARTRLAYDEIFLLQLYMAIRRHALTCERTGTSHIVGGSHLRALEEALTLTLTEDQVRAIAEIHDDMKSPQPMNRLLLGDVGTGKTLVAAHALAVSADTGAQSAMMAPTEVLAAQYASAIGPLLDSSGISWQLLTGSTPAAKKRDILGRVAEGAVQVLFGTHALLEEGVVFDRLSLAIVDEQHRFGVNQRLGLREKGTATDLLVMTATPIPRSLALTLYGDLETSYLRMRPNARSGVTTALLRPGERQRAYDDIRTAVREGRQAYVVCALVEESEAAEARAAKVEVERLRSKVFPELRIGLLTGRMRSSEKLRTMHDFRNGEIDVLVATTVIEVGVDVPNATVMMVEDADRFGLAQLHQLRGRVGRGAYSGRVYLVADPRNPESRERMNAIVSTEDGFELAELDLKLRGEGHILGDQQHGLPALKLASVITDGALIEQARADARAIIEKDPHLVLPEHAPLRDEVQRVFASAWKWVSSG